MFLLACETPPPVAEQAPAATAQQAQTASEKSRLCLELHAPRDSVQLGEPLSLVASLINCSSAPQQVDDLLSPEFGFLQVVIQPPDAKEELYRPVTNRDARGKGTRSLDPGDRLAALVPVYASADGWTLTRPGRHRFRAQYSVEAARLESKPIDVTITPPASQAERDAAEMMMSREVGWFLITGRDEKGEASRRLTTIVERYPSSRLALYARVGLAVFDSRDRFDPSTKAFRKDGCQRAADDLSRAPEIGDPSLASTGTAAWIRCLRQMGREKEVDGAIATFMKSHPAARNVASVNQMLNATRKQ